MSIDKNAPVNRIIVDDEEIPLATGGSGGEEVIQETYNSFTNAFVKIKEKVQDGKLFRVILTFNQDVIHNQVKRILNNGSWTEGSRSVTFRKGQRLIIYPDCVSASGSVYFTGGVINEAYTFGITGASDSATYYVNVVGYSETDGFYFINDNNALTGTILSSIEVQYFE